MPNLQWWNNSEPLTNWIKRQIESEEYWFLSMELPGGIVTPGWSNPKTEKLPFFGLPQDMRGLRVLDIGHAEGFFRSKPSAVVRRK